MILRLSAHYYYPIKIQLQRILDSNPDFEWNSSESSQNYTRDICDGTLYKRFLAETAGLHHKALSFTINTDGVRLSDKSDIALWPVFLALNELPINKRFSFNNMIIAGSYIHNAFAEYLFLNSFFSSSKVCQLNQSQIFRSSYNR